ncbi:hypothetical protein K7432_010144 [Basidiobolus ranarum]|uniref:Uncharacterized protein n=1 Tax=Basidiobolus ranarum TaxID=34480 RepID=A0ABR2VVX4_9FUNG
MESGLPTRAWICQNLAHGNDTNEGWPLNENTANDGCGEVDTPMLLELSTVGKRRFRSLLFHDTAVFSVQPKLRNSHETLEKSYHQSDTTYESGSYESFGDPDPYDTFLRGTAVAITGTLQQYGAADGLTEVLV